MGTSSEKIFILPLILGSITLFFISLGFSYLYLVPAALQFFISYSSDVIEPLWSFSQYCDFILVLFTTTCVAFQIPIFQVIIGAILTPSTDPITQILLSGAIVVLYLLGSGI